MHHTIEKIVARYYGLSVVVVDQIDNIYILSSGQQMYVLKCVESKNDEMMGVQSPYLVSVIRTRFKTFYVEYMQRYFYLMEYVLFDKNTTTTFTKALVNLADLHRTTYYTRSVPTEFYQFELTSLKEIIKTTFNHYEELMDDLLTKEVYYPGIWLLLELYPTLLNLKQTALELYEKYKEMVEKRDTCRFCLSLNQINLLNYSEVHHCFIKRDKISYEMVGKDFIKLVCLNIEFENIESFYLKNFHFEENEKIWMMINLLCIPMIDVYKDGYQVVSELCSLKDYILKLNKIMNSLQIENLTLYNDGR